MLRLFFLISLITVASFGCSSSGESTPTRYPAIREATPMPRMTAEELGIDPFVGSSVVASLIPTRRALSVSATDALRQE